MSSERRIAVMGATGYTGRLVVEELQRRGAPFLVAGRNAAKLARLSARVGDAPALVVDVADRGALARLARASRVIINCAGPFVDLGEPVVRAAIENGAHYLDTTGEQPFVKAMRAHDEEARRARVAVVPAMAFEIALADCAAAVAAEGFGEIESIHVTYAVAMRASQGTQRTALRILGSGGWAYAGGQWVEEAPGAQRCYADFPLPVGRRAALSFPGAEVITIPWHVRTREVRAFMCMPAAAVRVLAALSPLLPLVGRVAGRGAAWLVGQGTEGPDARARGESKFHLAVDARGVRGGRARQRRVLLRGADPYGLTAIIAASGAERMALPRYDRAGVLAPASALDPRVFLDSIPGVDYDVIDS